ncbi:MAG: GAF domain-containing protein [Myxococcota bacterium]
MKQWSVTHGVASVEVPASNWMVALGRGLDELGHASRLERLACEVLPNGTVIARDVTSGTGYVVQAVDAANDATDALGDDDEIIAVEGESDDIGGAPTRAKACEVALEAALRAVPGESGAVILAERGTLRFTAVHGPSSAKLRDRRIPADSGIAGFVIVHGRTIVIDDAQDDPRHAADIDALTGYVTRQIAAVPVGGGGIDAALGVIEVMNLTDGQRFQPEQLAELERVAQELAARLEL